MVPYDPVVNAQLVGKPVSTILRLTRLWGILPPYWKIERRTNTKEPTTPKCKSLFGKEQLSKPSQRYGGVLGYVLRALWVCPPQGNAIDPVMSIVQQGLGE